MKKQKEAQTVSMLEYVVIATLICAALAVGIWLFGAQICALFGVSGEATCATHMESAQKADECRAAGAAADKCGRWTAADEHECKASAADGMGHTTVRESMVSPVPLPDDGGEMPSEVFGR